MLERLLCAVLSIATLGSVLNHGTEGRLYALQQPLGDARWHPIFVRWDGEFEEFLRTGRDIGASICVMCRLTHS